MKNNSDPKKPVRATKPAKSRELLYERLEDRVLFDAVPDAPVDPEAQDDASLDQANAERFDTSLYADDVKTVSDASLLPRDDAPHAAEVSRELVIVDTSVENYQQLVADLLGEEDPFRDIEVVTIDGSQNGIGQISTVLNGYSGLDALHLVSHGDDSGVNLGDVFLTGDNLGGYAAEIAQWGNALSANGDLLFLGCDLASTAAGRELLSSISTLTGADVGASTDDTGYSARGGDWDLEFILGQMETSVAFSQDIQDNWTGLLAPGPDVSITTVNNDANAQIGDDVQFIVTFDNSAAAGSGDTGYGPFIDLLFPVNGADGAAGSDVADGLDFTDATYLGQPVTATELTFVDADGTASDNGTAGDTSDDTGSATVGYVSHPYLTEVQNELQFVSFSGAIDGGILGVSIDGQSTSIDMSATGGTLTAADLQSTLEGLSNIGSGNVSVTGDMLSGFFVEFVGSLAETNVAEISFDGSLLENGGSTANPHGSFAASTITNGDEKAQAVKIYGTPGDKLVVLELPFGSITPEQPEVAVTVNAKVSDLADVYTGADPNAELTVRARSGFRFGADAQDNGDVDPALLSDTQNNAGDWVKSSSIRPTLITVETDIEAPESETATGPNYPRTFVVRVDIPDGQTIQDLDISDLLPNNIVFLSLESITSTDPSTTFTTNVPGGTNSQGNSTNKTAFAASNGYPPVDVGGARDGQSLVVTADSITGSDGNDITIRFSAYVTEFEADATGTSSGSVIGVDGDDDLAGSVYSHTASATGDWVAIDPRDVGPNSTDNAVAPPHSTEVDSKSLAIQKSVEVVGGGSFTAAGSLLRYTLTFQISDYFTFGDLELSDTFSDGQRFHNAAGFGPTFSVSDHNTSFVDQAFNVHVGGETAATTEATTDNFIVDQSQIDNSDDAIELGNGTYADGSTDTTDGSTSIRVELSERLQQLLDDGILQGGHSLDGDSNSANVGSATGTIVFYTETQQNFSDDFPSGDRSVDQDDELSNVVSISGSVRENAEDGDIANIVGTESDGSATSISVEVGTLSKSIYAINGNTALPVDLSLQPGDTITYRLAYTLPNTDFESLKLTDYLPLPALNVDDFDADGAGGDVWSFESNGTFDATPGIVGLGPNDTFFSSDPGRSDYFSDSNIVVDAAANSIEFNFGTYDDSTNPATQIELLFTVTVQDDKFADGLYLTNIARATYGATNVTTEPADALVQIELSQPVVSITKGVVATDDASVPLNPVGPTVNNEVQLLNYVGSGSGETFSLGFGGQTTVDIPVTATAATIQAQLESLASIAAGDVSVVGGRLVDGDIAIEFTNGLAGTDVAELVVATNDGSGIVPVVVSTELQGASPIAINGVGSGTPFTGRVTSSALAAQAIDLDHQDITNGLEAGDTVRFMIVVENTGTGSNGAFDVQVRDALPPEFEYVAGSLSVVDGQGTALSFTNVGGHPDHALFGSGILLDDASAAGALDAFSSYDGGNLAIITYDAQLIDEAAFANDDVEYSETITNTAVLVSYAGAEGGADHTASRHEVQQIASTDPLVGGTYTLTFDGQTTTAIDFDADRNAVRNALEALSSIGVGNVIVSGTNLSDGPLSLTFTGALGDTNVGEVSIDESGLHHLAVTDVVNGATNAVQTIQAVGDVQGGFFTLSFGGETTSALGFNATAATVQAALESLSGISSGDVAVTGGTLPDTPMAIEFVGSLAGQGVSNITIDPSNVLGGGELQIATTTEGADSEVQTLATAGNITGGTFTLEFDGNTTAPIAHTASAATIESALESLAGIGVGNVNVTGGALPGSPVVVEFIGSLAGTDVVKIVVDDSALVAGDILSVSTTTEGSYNEIQSLTAAGTITGGTYTLTFDGETTAPLAGTADAATIQAALETLNGIPAGSVMVTGDLADGFAIEFVGALQQQNVDSIVVDSGLLVGGTLDAATLRTGSAEDPSDDASVVIRGGSLSKSIASTSEAHTSEVGGFERLTVGEIVRYRIQVELPGGTSTNIRILDKLPSGLAFIDDNTAILSFVGDTPGSITSTIGAGALPDDAVSRNASNNRDDYTSGRDVWFKLGDIVNTETDTNAEYAVVEFNALVMNNTSSNAGNNKHNDAELWVDGEEVFDLPNADRPRITIAEPILSTPQKQVKLGSGSYAESVSADAGDVVDFRVTFSNGSSNNNSDAFEVRLLDAVPADLSLDVSTIRVYIDGLLQTSGTDYTDSSSATTDTIDLVIDQLAKGQSVEVRYSVTLDAAVSPNQTLTNTANVTWSSLPGDFGTANLSGGNATGSDLASLNNLNTNGAGTDDQAGVTYDSESGEGYGERNGTSAGAHNDYRRSDTAAIAVAGTKSITKTLVATSIDDSGTNGNNILTEAVIGEIATYTVTVEFNEGTMPNAQIVDVLDPGLAFVGVTSSSSSDIGFSGGRLNTPSVSADGRTITWDLGTVTDSAVGDVSGAGDSDGSITITYQAIVTNVIGNQATGTLNNSVTFSFDDDPSTAPNPRDTVTASATNLNIIEPSISIGKTVALDTDGDGAYDDGKTGDAGDAVQYTITLTNASGVDAFDIEFNDPLPTVGGGSSAILGATVAVFSDSATSGATTSGEFELAGNDATGYTLRKVAGSNIDLLASQTDGSGDPRTITLTIQGTIASSVTPNLQVGNTATVDWTSINGTLANPSAFTTDDTQRTGADGTGSGNLNNYEASATDTFTISQPEFTKHLISTDQTETAGTDVTIGEVVTYALKVSMPEGVAPDATVVDLLPPGLDYESFEIITDVSDSRSAGLLSANFAGTIAGGVPSVTGGAAAGDDVTFTFGQINITVDNDDSNNAFLILVNARVVDVATNTGYDGNQTTLTNDATIDFSFDTASPQNVASTIAVTVVEPSLEITKEFGPTVNADLADSGDTVTVNLTVSNADGESGAYEVAVADTLNPLHYDLSSINLGTSGVNYPADFSVSFNSTSGLLQYSGGDIAAGASVTFSVTIDLLKTVTPNQTLTNTATITDGSTLEGLVTGERNSPDADGDGSDVDTDTVLIRSNSLSGFVWDDANNDGVKQASEAGINGVEVRIVGTDHHGNDVDLIVSTSGTGANAGTYQFENLRPGTYSIQQDPNGDTIPADYLDGKDSIGTPGGIDSVNDVFLNVNLPTGTETNGANNNFGEIQDADLSGAVYHDANNNGAFDGTETGINGVQVQLTGTNDLGQNVTLNVTTAGGGLYRFTGLRPSDASGYTITQVVEPAGYLDGKDADGSLANGDATSANNVISSINVVPGNSGSAYNFGEVLPSVLSGYVYHDTDNDGQRSDEPAGHGIQNSRITLTGVDDLGNAVSEFVDTDGSGYFEFTGLRPSNTNPLAGAVGYTLKQTIVPSAFIDGKDTIGSQGGDATVNNEFGGISVTSGTTGTENNFAELLPASLSGSVFNDHDNDGTFEPGNGEAGIQGVSIRIQGTDDLGNAVDVTLQTNSDGDYTFTNLRPSDSTGYSVTETHPVVYTDGTDSDGSLANGVAGNDIITSINVSSGDVGEGYDFGEQGSTISGTVFVDDNRDGDLDSGEATRLGGITVELFDMTDPLLPVSLGTTTTEVDGTYRFDNLPAGDYQVVQTQPAQYGNTSTNTINLTLPLTGSGGNNFGEALYDIGDTIYFDADNNGTQNIGEQGIADVQVSLQYAGADGIFGNSDDPVAQSTITNASGAYSFTELFVGNYRVSVTATDLPGGVVGTDEADDIAFGAASINGTSNIAITNADRFDADFGYTGSGTIGDFVWVDVDGDGVQDSGEPGLNDVTVNLTFAGEDNIFGNDDDLILTTETDSSGAYSFANLPAGDFRIAVDAGDSDLPNSITPVSGAESISGTANVTLATGGTNNDIDFGFSGTLEVGDRLWLDQDGDQIQDSAEPGLPDVSVTLVWFGQDGTLGTSDDVTLLDTTDANGEYGFTNLPDGNYRVSYSAIDLPSAVSPTYEVDGTTNNQVNFPLAGSSRSDVDFGFAGVGSISDLVWLDADGDGLQEAGEPGLANVDVILTFAGADGNFATTNDNITITTSTDADGNYSFAGLPDGDFRVAVDTADSDLPSSITPVNGAESISGTANVTLDATQRTYTNIDFGFAGTRTIGDFVWIDLNGDGNQDSSEPGLGSVDVTLLFAGQDGVFGTADDVTKSTTTAANGSYSFASNPDGEYQVTIDTNDLPVGVTPTGDVDGTPDNRGDVTVNGADRNDIDFGYTGARSLGDRFWYDANADGNQDAGEPGISGVGVVLTYAGKDNTFGNADDFVLTTVTAVDGNYSFDGLPEGDYQVSFDASDLPSGMTTGTDEIDDASPAIDGTAHIGLGAVDRTDVDFGFAGVRSLGDFVFLDTDNDGNIDAGEPGFGDVDVTLLFAGQDGIFGSADDVTRSTTTAADGSYNFANLPNGNFQISIDTSDLPAGTIQTHEGDGTIGNQLDVVINGSDVNTGDFGFAGSGSVSNFVWLDADGDGVQEAGEPGLAEVSVNLTSAGEDGIFGNADDFTLSTSTSSTGNYSFDNLPAGDYRIAVDAADTDLPDSLIAVAGTESINGTANVTLSVGGARSDVDFGFTGSLNIGDRIWYDADGDSVQDATNEPGLAGVDITLIYAGQDGTYGTADDITKNTTTGANGAYSFGKLSDGDYQIIVDTTDLPTGAVQTFDVDQTPFSVALDNTARIMLQGVDRDDVDFGYLGGLSLGDTLFHDMNADGSQAVDEPGIAGIDVIATFAGADNTFGTADDFAVTTTTSSTGDYVLDNLFGGEYRISVEGSDLPRGLNVPTSEADDSAAALDGTANISLTTNRDDVDFGFTGARTIGDRLWFDANADGVQDVIGEPGFVGVDVTIVFAGPNGAFGDSDDASLTTTTAADGRYSFGNLPDGTFRINYDLSDLPSGIVQTYEQDASINNQANVTVSGADIDTIDFGFNGNGRVSDYLWIDVDGDGLQEADEPALHDIDVVATFAGADGTFGNADDFTFTTTTDSNGLYSFDNLPDGDYRVVVDTTDTDLPESLNPVSGLESNSGTVAVTLNATQRIFTNVDFGFVGTNTVGDFVWFDSDGDGAQDATNEPGLGLVDLTLTFAGQDGIYGNSDDFTRTTTTDSNGAYSFGQLPDGAYRVAIDTADLPAGLTQTFEQNDGADGLAHTAEFIVNAADRSDIDFGYSGALSIGDTVWYDVDGNSLKAANEPGLNNIDVNLLFAGANGTFGDADDFQLATTTVASGAYNFANLPQGNYRIDVDATDLPRGMNIITAEADDFSAANDGTSNIALTTDRTDVDFGFRGARSLGDRIWFDGNGDGVQDATNEPGLGDVRVNLLFAGQDGLFGTSDDVALQDTTDSSGNYQFTDLPDGEFQISVETSDLPSGMDQTFEVDGTAVGDNNNRADITVAGVDTDIVDFGFRGAGTIGDRVWHDTDGDGVQDGSNEPGLVGVTVNLAFAGEDGVFGTADDFSMTTTTGTNGTYSFDNLPAGDFRVDIVETDIPGSRTSTFERDDSTNAIAGVAEVSLSVGQIRDDVDFGYTGTLTLGDRVWFDANNDGLQSVGEPGLNGIGVTLLYAGPDGNFATTADNITLTTTTDSSGNYRFENLLDGDYTVVIQTSDLPGGAIQTADTDDAAVGPVSLDHTSRLRLAGTSRTDADFGYRGNSSIGDLIFFDADNSGTLNAGDRGLPGIDVTAEVDVNGDNVVDYTVTVTTDINGAYLFGNLIPGSYTVTVDDTDLPPGMAANPTVDPDGVSTPHTTTVNLGSNETNATTNFGYNSVSTIGDFIWLDTNGDGLQDATNEPGLANVDVALTWYGADGVLDAGSGGDDEVFTTTTDASGAYVFEFLASGNYQIAVEKSTAPGNTSLTTANDGIVVTLPIGGSIDTIDFGFVGGATGGGTIGDRVFFDHNGNGIEDGDDVPYPDVDITIVADIDGDGIDESFTATTDSNGFYEVPGLPYGNYTVSIAAPNGTNPTFDSDGISSPNSSNVTLDDTNKASDTQDFGLTGNGTVGDTVFFDEDGNGVQDGAEVGIPGVAVQIDVDLDGDGNPDFTTTAVTDQDGKYNVTNIPEGQVTVSVAPPAGSTPTTDHDGTVGGDSTNLLNLPAGSTDNSSDFGFQGTGSIGDTVFFDADSDGVQDDGSGTDPSEPGLPDVRVFLDIDFNGDGTIDRTLQTTTAADGTYQFSNLPAGNYTVRVNQPAGTTPTVDADGIAGASSNQSSHTLSPGENNTAQNFGYTGTGAITDSVFFDIDKDGTEEVGSDDRGLPGVEVTLNVDINGDGNPDYTTTVPTDANGDFIFTNLIPGTYTITTDPADMPPGLAANPTIDNDGIGSAHEADYSVSAGSTTEGPGFGFHATPDYDIVKTGNGTFTNAKPGDTVTYTIVVANVGELDGRNVTITDNFPTGVLNITDAGGGTIDAVDGIIKWDIAALAPTQQQIFTVTAEVINPIAAGINDFTNSVSVDDDRYNGDDPDTTNNTSSYTATLDAAPDYSITKTNGVGIDTLQPGDNTTYTITVTNTGNQNGTGVVVTDKFPVGILSVANADGGTVDAAAGTITWNLGDLDVDNIVILQPTFHVVSPSVSGQQDVANAADIKDDGTNGTDPTPGNNSATDIDTLNAVPDYRITKTLNGSPANVAPNQTLVYSILVENIGDQNGTGVIVTDTYPTDSLTNVTAAGATIDSTTGIITWTIGDLDGNGDSVLLTVTAEVRSTLGTSVDDLINTASVTDDLSNGTDPNPDNNTDNDVRPIDASPDLVIEKSDDDATNIRPGETVVYTINFGNVGQQEATNVVITETVPDGSEFNSEDSAAGWVDQGDGTYTFDVASLPAGDSGSIEFAVTVADTRDPNKEQLENVVTIADDGTNGADLNTANNRATDSTPLQVFTFDSFQDFSGNSNDLESYDAENGRRQGVEDPYKNRLKPLPIDTVYTGIVDPGTTLSGKIYDEHGRMVGEQIVVADSAGNWLMQFPTVVLFEAPHEMRIDQTLSVQNSTFDAGFNLRRFFHPAVHTQLYMNQPLSIGAAFYHSPSNVLEAMHEANNNPLGFGWMHHAYELVVSSTNTSAM